jgi:hypothetical protein
MLLSINNQHLTLVMIGGFQWEIFDCYIAQRLQGLVHVVCFVIRIQLSYISLGISNKNDDAHASVHHH